MTRITDLKFFGQMIGDNRDIDEIIDTYLARRPSFAWCYGGKGMCWQDILGDSN